VILVRMGDSDTNPYESKQIESFEIFSLTNGIQDTNLLEKGLRIESTIRILKVLIRESGFANPKLQDSDLRIFIFKDSFCAIVLRICKDLLDS
jgi:hypothetical protein